MKKILSTLMMSALVALPMVGQRTVQTIESPERPAVAAAVESSTETPLQPLADTYTVKCQFTYNSSSLTPYRVVYMSKTTSMTSVQTTTLTLHTLNLSLPADTYTIYAEFYPLDESGRGDVYSPKTIVMHSDVTVNANCELTFDAATATNKVDFAPVTPGGDALIPPMMVVNGSDISWDYTNATAMEVWVSTSLMHPDLGEVYSLVGNYGHCRDDGRTGASSYNLRINALPESMSIAHTVLAYTTDNRTMLAGLTCKGLPSATLTNSAADYVEYSEHCQHSPLVSSFPRQYRSKVVLNSYVKNLFMSDFNVETTLNDISLWVACPEVVDPSAAIEFTAKPTFYEYDSTVDSQRYTLAVEGCPLRFNASGRIYENPFNTYFYVTDDKMTGSAGDRMPHTAVYLTNKKVGDYRQYTFTPSFVGRWGETRQADITNLVFTVRHNDETVCTSLDDFTDWAAAFATDNHTKGTLSFTVENFLGEVEGLGSNCVNEITVVETAYDVCPPILQYVTFMDADGTLTDKFDSLEGASLVFTGCDASGTGTSYMDFKSSKVEVAPYGSNNYTTITARLLKAMESRSSLSVYGASLAGVTAPSSTGWYDLRITLDDYYGNKCVTTLSPAFCNNKITAIDGIAASAPASISWSNGMINVKGMENPLVEVFDITGRLMLRAQGNAPAADFAPGVYVVKAFSEGKEIVAKILIK